MWGSLIPLVFLSYLYILDWEWKGIDSAPIMGFTSNVVLFTLSQQAFMISLTRLVVTKKRANEVHYGLIFLQRVISILFTITFAMTSSDLFVNSQTDGAETPPDPTGNETQIDNPDGTSQPTQDPLVIVHDSTEADTSSYKDNFIVVFANFFTILLLAWLGHHLPSSGAPVIQASSAIDDKDKKQDSSMDSPDSPESRGLKRGWSSMLKQKGENDKKRRSTPKSTAKSIAKSTTKSTAKTTSSPPLPSHTEIRSSSSEIDLISKIER